MSPITVKGQTVAWSWSLRPGSWGIWLDRKAEPPWWLWRLNVGPLHVIGRSSSASVDGCT